MPRPRRTRPRLLFLALLSVLAAAVTTALWDGTNGALQCTSGGPVTGPGGSFPDEACSVRPDPTNGRGCLTPRMLNVATQLMAQGWRVSCWDEHAWNPNSDHPRGKACDAFPGRGGVLPTPEERARGDALAASLQASAAQTGVSLQGVILAICGTILGALIGIRALAAWAEDKHGKMATLILAGAVVAGALDARDPTAALGFAGGMKELPKYTTKGGMLYVFGLP